MIKSSLAEPTRPATSGLLDAALAVDHAPAESRGVDACAYLFRACRDLQRVHRERGLEILFDVDAIKLPVAACHTIASIVRAVVEDVIGAAPSLPAGGAVGLTLRRRGTSYAVVIADRGLRDYDQESDHDPKSVRALAARLGGDCRIRASSECRAVMLAFEPNAAVDLPPSIRSASRFLA